MLIALIATAFYLVTFEIAVKYFEARKKNAEARDILNLLSSIDAQMKRVEKLKSKDNKNKLGLNRFLSELSIDIKGLGNQVKHGAIAYNLLQCDFDVLKCRVDDQEKTINEHIERASLKSSSCGFICDYTKV